MTADARSYLTQQAQRLRLAVKEIRTEMGEREKRDKEIQHDLIMILAALDDLEDETRQ